MILPRIAYHALRQEPREQAGFERANLPPVLASQPRIVWILMDELSYDQVFETPALRPHVPNFDTSRQRSITFSNLQPTGYLTEEVIPGLILGQQIADVEHMYGHPFRFRSNEARPMASLQSFADDLRRCPRLGWTTGIAGWYNPYCRFCAAVSSIAARGSTPTCIRVAGEALLPPFDTRRIWVSAPAS